MRIHSRIPFRPAVLTKPPAPAPKPAPAVAPKATAPLSEKAADGRLLGADGKVWPPETPLDQIPAALPSKGTPKGTLIEVNGVGCPLTVQRQDLQSIADATGMRVVGLHNAAEGMVADVFQAALDLFGAGKNLAVDSLTRIVMNELEAGRPLHLVAHSQGALITARALKNVKEALTRKYGARGVEERLANVKVETLASAAPRWVDGPQYVHYVNKKDPVPNLFGTGSLFRHLGRGARLITFSERSDFHLIPTYLEHRVPFEEARRAA